MRPLSTTPAALRLSARGPRLPLLLLLLFLVLSAVDPRPLEGQDSAQLERVKQDILARLGLEKPPTVHQTPGPAAVREMQRLYRETVAQLQANQTQRPPATSVHRLPLKLEPIGEASSSESGPLRHLYRLEVSRTADLHQHLQVLRAELRILQGSLPPLRGTPQSNQSRPAGPLKVHRLADEGDPAATPKVPRASRGVPPALDLKAAVEEWLASPESRLRLGLEVPSPAPAPWLNPGRETLVLEVEARQRHGRARKARQLEEEEECATEDGKCCLRSLRVSFEAIGWSDWVVAPRSYSMKFCDGSCPHNYKPASLHAQIKARLHSLSGETPAPCCVPAAYEPMVLMHYGSEGRVVTQLFEDMIVTRCHCA
uniref:Growth/differentiation factor 15 n=1 Tax=Pogona vitticeps TaxID=103695 RepID=A0A6J0SKI9_9SAUR